MTAWKRTYFAVFVANLITAIAMMSFLPFFPSYLEELGVESRADLAVWAGLCFGAAPFAAAIMGPFWGSIGDRLGRKLMIVRALLAIALFVGGMAFVTTPLQLLALRLGQGVFSGFIPPSMALVSISAPHERQGRVTGTLQSALAAGGVFGPLLGAWIQPLWGMRAVFVLVGCSALASALLVALLAHEDASLRSSFERWTPTAVLQSVGKDFVRTLRVQPLRRGLLLVFAVQFGLGASNPQMELYVRDLIAGTPQEIKAATAMLFTLLSVANFVATPLWARAGDAIGHGRVLVLAALASGLVLGLHAVLPVYALLVVARFMLGASVSGTNTASFGLAATETGVEHRGSAMAVVFSARAFAVSIGAMCGGALASHIGIPALFLATGIVIVLASFVLRIRASA